MKDDEERTRRKVFAFDHVILGEVGKVRQSCVGRKVFNGKAFLKEGNENKV